ALVCSSLSLERAIRSPRTGQPNRKAVSDYPESKMNRRVPNPVILYIAPYTHGKTPVPEPGRKVFKLSANETPFGPSPKAKEAYRQAGAGLGDYAERRQPRV